MELTKEELLLLKDVLNFSLEYPDGGSEQQDAEEALLEKVSEEIAKLE